MTLLVEVFTLDGESLARIGDILGGLHKLGVNGSPRRTFGSLGDGEGLTILLYGGLHIAYGSGGLRQFQRLTIDTDVGLCSIQTQTVILTTLTS